MRRTTAGSLAVLFMIGVAGCGDAGAQPSASAATTPAPSPTVVSPTPGFSLVYARQGGIAGASDRLLIRADGAYEIQTRAGNRTGKLTAAQMGTLRSALERADFASIPRDSGSGGIADGYTYTVTYNGHEVVAEDGGIPPALEPVVQALNALLAE